MPDCPYDDCRRAISDSDVFCPHCGRNLRKFSPEDPAPPTAAKPSGIRFPDVKLPPVNLDRLKVRSGSPITAGVLSLIPFTGPLGIGFFYTGSWALGVVTLLTTLLSGGCLGVFVWVVSIVHGLRLVYMSQEEYDARYNVPHSAFLF